MKLGRKLWAAKVDTGRTIWIDPTNVGLTKREVVEKLKSKQLPAHKVVKVLLIEEAALADFVVRTGKLLNEQGISIRNLNEELNDYAQRGNI